MDGPILNCDLFRSLYPRRFPLILITRLPLLQSFDLKSWVGGKSYYVSTVITAVLTQIFIFSIGFDILSGFAGPYQDRSRGGRLQMRHLRVSQVLFTLFWTSMPNELS